MFHLHSWRHLFHSKASYRPNVWQIGISMIVSGMVQQCGRCPKFRILPDQPGYRPVEVELA